MSSGLRSVCAVVSLCALALGSARAAPQASGFPIANSSESELCAAVVFDGASFLVGIQGDAADHSNVGARFISPSGAVGPWIGTGRTGGAPLLAFSGTHTLMIWEDDITHPDTHLYGQLIDTAGNQGALIQISTAAGADQTSGVGYGGGTYLAAYVRGIGLYARLVSPAGVVGPELTIGNTVGEINIDNVASDGTGFLVVWPDDPDSHIIKGRLVSAGGVLGPVFDVNASTALSTDPVYADFDGSNYLVAWGDQVGGSAHPEEWDLFGQRVAPGTGSLVGGVIPISTAPGHQMGPCLGFDGSKTLVTWTDMRNDANGSWACDPGEGTCWDIWGRCLDPSGALLGSAWPIIGQSGDQWASPVAFGAGRFLMTWTDGLWVDEGGDVYGSFLAPEPVKFYCTGKTNSLGCVPYMDVRGIASASDVNPFTLFGKQALPGEIGLLLYGFSKANLDFHGGKLCVNPFKRLYPAKVAKSTGAPPCIGVLKLDFNQRIQGGGDPMLTAGATVRSQWRQRDPSDPSGFADSLTNAVQFVVGP